MNDAAHDLSRATFAAHASAELEVSAPDSARSGTYRAVRPRVDAAGAVPAADMRRERLAQISSLVAAGLWRTDADEVAERIVSESAA